MTEENINQTGETTQTAPAVDEQAGTMPESAEEKVEETASEEVADEPADEAPVEADADTCDKCGRSDCCATK